MANSQNISKNNKQDRVSWVIRHRNLTSLIVSLLGLLISVYFTDILKPRPPHFEFNIVKLIVDISVSGIVWFLTQIALTYINGVLIGLHELKTKFIGLVNSELNKIYETTANAFYKGFFCLLSGGKIQAGLKSLEQSLGQAITSDYIGRSVIFNFLIDSISRMGESGFVMVHSSVGDYVNYLSRVLEDTEINISATCVVRPFWFMTDEVKVHNRGQEAVVLAPFYTEPDRFGKAEHLPLFSAKEGVKYQRILVVDENIIAEVLLTGYIDRIVANNKGFSSISSFQPLSVLGLNSISDIWEIEWFKTQVNQNQGVDLKYTFLSIDSKTKGEVKELDDRIYGYKNSRLKLEIKFQFTNLERGNLYVTWGDQTIPLEFIEGIEYRCGGRTHRIYNNFKDLLSIPRGPRFKEKMLRYLDYLLLILTEQYWGHELLIVDERLNRLIGPNNKTLQKLINQAINTLKNDLDRKELKEIYDNLIQNYNTHGVPERAYVITYDKGHPELPIRVAHWGENWREVQRKCKKI